VKKKALILSLLLLAPLLVLSKAEASNCTPTSQTTDGPYYTKAASQRKIASNQPGYKIIYKLKIQNKNCEPFPNLSISLWQANSQGQYSLVKNSLRGNQITNKQGLVTFESVFPGWYPTRAAHLHVKILSQDKTLLSTQLFFPQELVDKIYQTKPYLNKGKEQISKENDQIYQSLPNLIDMRYTAPRTLSATLTL
jgi:protocatechuate 3,4-dioxygenase beta subunit